MQLVNIKIKIFRWSASHMDGPPKGQTSFFHPKTGVYLTTSSAAYVAYEWLARPQNEAVMASLWYYHRNCLEVLYKTTTSLPASRSRFEPGTRWNEAGMVAKRTLFGGFILNTVPLSAAEWRSNACSHLLVYGHVY